MRSKFARFKSALWVMIPALALVVMYACSNNGASAKEKPKYNFKDGQGPNGALVVIEGKPYSEEELMGEDKMEFADAMKRIYDLRMERVGRLLLEASYGEEAKKNNMPIEEYLEKKVLKGDVKIPDADYNKFVKERNIPKEQLNDQLKERIMAYMKAQKRQEQVQGLIAKLAKEKKVDLYFKKPDLKVNVEVGTSASAGSKDAKVTVVEFSDFQCPFCSRGAAVLNEIKKKYGNKVLVAFKHFPLPSHPQAKPAAMAAECVKEQSVDKFWKYHDKLFAAQDKLDNENLKKFAKEVGVKEADFNQCFDSKKYEAAVQADMDYGSKLGIRSTPTFIVNGKLVQGAQPFESFKEMIDEDL